MYVRLEVLLRFAFREQTEEELTTNKRARPTPQPPRRRCSTRLHFKRRCCGMFEGLLEIFPTLLGDDILNHLWFPWPVGTAEALLGPPPASGEILIHRSHGCSSNPPADAPSLLPRQPATCLLWHACVSVCLTQSVHSSVHLSVKRVKPEASVIKMHTGYLKGQ